jgi:hypothetical protein
VREWIALLPTFDFTVQNVPKKRLLQETFEVVSDSERAEVDINQQQGLLHSLF